MTNRRLAVGFSAWRRLIRKQRSADPMSIAAAYLLHRTLARGWVSWLSNWDSSQGKQNLARKSLAYMMHREQVRAWAAWMAKRDEMARTGSLLFKGMAYMMHREAAKGMSRWVRHLQSDADVLTSKAQRGYLRWRFRKWSRGSRKKELATRAIQFALHGDLARCWHKLRSRQRLSKEVLARRAANMFISRGLVRGFHAWLHQKNEEDMAMHLTFASAASMLPLSSMPPTGGASPAPTFDMFAALDSPKSSSKSLPRSPLPRSPARPRMVFH